MPWVRFADDYLTNAKLKDLGPYARLLDFAGILYSARELRDGELSLSDVRAVAEMALIRRWRPAANDLCAVGRWMRNADGSYTIHDYLEYQPSRAQVLASRREKHEAKVRAGRAGGIAKASKALAEPLAKRYQNPSPVPGPGINSMSTRQKQQPEHARARSREVAPSPELLAEHERRLEQERSAAAPAQNFISEDDDANEQA